MTSTTTSVDTAHKTLCLRVCAVGGDTDQKQSSHKETNHVVIECCDGFAVVGHHCSGDGFSAEWALLDSTDTGDKAVVVGVFGE